MFWLKALQQVMEHAAEGNLHADTEEVPRQIFRALGSAITYVGG
jgi:hypothetical protein